MKAFTVISTFAVFAAIAHASAIPPQYKRDIDVSAEYYPDDDGIDSDLVARSEDNVDEFDDENSPDEPSTGVAFSPDDDDIMDDDDEEDGESKLQKRIPGKGDKKEDKEKKEKPKKEKKLKVENMEEVGKKKKEKELKGDNKEEVGKKKKEKELKGDNKEEVGKKKKEKELKGEINEEEGKKWKKGKKDNGDQNKLLKADENLEEVKLETGGRKKSNKKGKLQELQVDDVTSKLTDETAEAGAEVGALEDDGTTQV